MWQELARKIKDGDTRALARSISLVENEQPGYFDFLQQLPAGHTHITGITGPPGAGKSTLVDGLVGSLAAAGKKVAVLCVDPSSPFHQGAVLGDRIRMSQWYNHTGVYIRSLASRGSIGGLNPMIIEITALVQCAGFDHIIIETVGIGQSEVEIASLADTTVVVLVPEAGDEIQTMKSGLMEIADIFVVNKSDRPDADHFANTLRMMLAPAFQRKHQEIPIVKTVASEKKGIPELAAYIDQHGINLDPNRSIKLIAARAIHLLQRLRMQAVDVKQLELQLAVATTRPDFNLFAFVQDFNTKIP